MGEYLLGFAIRLN